MIEETNPTKRYHRQYIEVLSVFSALAVVMLHANECFWTFSYERYWVTANFIENVFYFAVPVFIMITGCNLIDYRDSYYTKTYIVKRCKRALLPFIVWSIIGLFYQIALGNVNVSDLSIAYIIDGILNSKFVSVYWFFIPLFAVYFAIPVISLIPKDKRQRAFAYVIIMMFIFSYLLPLLSKTVADGISYNSALYFPFGGYLFYAVCGYYIDRYPIDKKWRKIIYLLGIAGFLTQLLGTWYLSYEAGNMIQTFKGYTNVPCICYSVAIFVAFKYIDKSRLMNFLQRICKPFANVTLGIYLCHWYFLDLVKHFGWFSTYDIVYRILGGFVVFLIAGIISKMLKKIPGLKNIV